MYLFIIGIFIGLLVLCFFTVVKPIYYIAINFLPEKAGRPKVKISNATIAIYAYSLFQLFALGFEFNAKNEMFNKWSIACFCLGLTGLFISILNNYITKKKKRSSSESLITHTAIILSFFMIFFGNFIIPNFVALKHKAYSASARSSGGNAKRAQEEYFKNKNTYADNLTELLTIDPNLTDDPAVTFIFDRADQSGFSLKAMHSRSNFERWYEYESDN